MNNLINYLIEYAEKHGIIFNWFDGNPNERPYSQTNLNQNKKISMNINWKFARSIPFEIGHLIGHLENNSKHEDMELLKFEREKMKKMLNYIRWG